VASGFIAGTAPVGRSDNTHRFSDEVCLVVRDDEANDDLEREPGVADALDVEEGSVRVSPLLFQPPPGRATHAGANGSHVAPTRVGG